MQIGYAFRELERFVGREHTARAFSSVGSAKHGPRRGNNARLYRNALASGVNDVLTTYEANILRLEQDILRGALPALPAALESALSVYTELLPALWAGTVEPVAHSGVPALGIGIEVLGVFSTPAGSRFRREALFPSPSFRPAFVAGHPPRLVSTAPALLNPPPVIATATPL